MSDIWYDDAVPAFASLVVDTLGLERGQMALQENIILRDAAGLLTFVVIKDIASEELEVLARRAGALHPYVDQLPVATPDQLFDDSLREPGAGTLEWITDDRFTGFVRLLERRIGGGDWLRIPSPPMAEVPPVIVFASFKGGAGRTTALSVAAAHLAARGLEVLVIDLDLEAPGLGTALLPADRIPAFGALDYYVENGLRPLDDDFFRQMVAISPLTTGRGVVDVVPAVGARGDRAPHKIYWESWREPTWRT